MSDKAEQKAVQKKKLKYSDEEDESAEETKPTKERAKKSKKAKGSDDEDNDVITYDDDNDSDEPKKKSKDKSKAKDKKDASKSDSKNGEKRKAEGQVEEKGNEVMIHIHKLKKVTVSKFKGQLYVGIREYYEKDGDIMPTKKGCNLPLDAWEQLKDCIPQIDAAVKKLK